MNVRIDLRPFEKSDADQLALLANNVKVAAYLKDSFPSPYSIQDAVGWIDFCHQLEKSNSYPRAIIYQGKLVGAIGVIGQSDVYRNNAEIGYWLGEPYWSKGIASEAVKQMTSWTFENTSILRLYAGVFEPNKTSMRVLEKSGYQLEAVHKRAIVKAGEIFDEYFYVKFRD